MYSIGPVDTRHSWQLNRQKQWVLNPAYAFASQVIHTEIRRRFPLFGTTHKSIHHPMENYQDQCDIVFCFDNFNGVFNKC